MNRFANKSVVITGGSGGIGSVTGKLMAEEGARVLLVDIDEKALKEIVRDFDSDPVEYAVADVTKPEQVKAYVDKAVELFGGIDIFFNNAGVEGNVAPLDEYSLDEYHQLIHVNVNGMFFGLHYVFPVMKKNDKGGSIIMTSSVAGLMGTANVTPYVTSKHAVIGMMRSAALEGAGHNIRVNTVNPSPVDNRMMRSLESGFNPDESEKAKEQFEQMIPLGRYATNEEIAKMVMFLASEDSEFITGTVNPVDGGMTA
ncbi:MAG: SDR family NAD(P)-dependent oxidoreductase [Bacteroidales bacterium]